MPISASKSVYFLLSPQTRQRFADPLPWKPVSFLSLSLSCWTDDGWNWFPSFLIFIFRKASPLLNVKFYLYHPLLSTRVFLTQPALCFGQHSSLWMIHKLHIFSFFSQFSVRQKVSQMQQVKSLMSAWFHKISNWNRIVSSLTFALENKRKL